MRSDSGEPEVSWGESICQGTAPPLFMEKSREIPIEATLQAQGSCTMSRQKALFTVQREPMI